jgi:hypothetical protein
MLYIDSHKRMRNFDRYYYLTGGRIFYWDVAAVLLNFNGFGRVIGRRLFFTYELVKNPG